MHNLMSYNELAGWKPLDSTLDRTHNDLINDYYECLIECDEDQSSCKKICKEVFA